MYSVNSKRLLITLYISVLFTIIAIRLFSWMFPQIFLNDFDLYHFYFGIMLLLIGSIILLFTPLKNENIPYKIILFSIGIGLTVDQFIFLIVKEKTEQGYWELPSLLGTLLFTVTIFIYILFLFVFRANKIEQYRIHKKISDYFLIQRKNEFYAFLVAILLGVIAPRIVVFMSPGTSTMFFDFEIHHLYWGVLILIIFMLPSIVFGCLNHIKIKFATWNFIFVGIGMGLIIDEFVFLLSGGKTDYDYWQNSSSISAFFLLLIVIILTSALYMQIKKQMN